MKCLLIDDNVYKIEKIKKTLKEIIPEIEFLIELDLNSAMKSVKKDYQSIDFIVCDMQFPKYHNDRIDMYSGIEMIKFIEYFKGLKEDTSILPMVIASSDENIAKTLMDAGYGDTYSIPVSSGYSITEPFKEWLVEIGIFKSEEYIADTEFKDILNKFQELDMKPSFKKKKVKTEADEVKIKLAENKRLLKQAKRAKDIDLINKLVLERKELKCQQ